MSREGSVPVVKALDFMAQFGASCRTKNVEPEIVDAREKRRRRYPVPNQSGLPPEFIRLDPWEADYLFGVARLARKGIVEIGRKHGGSTFLLACANQDVPIWSIDKKPADDEKLMELCRGVGVGGNLELLTGLSQEVPPDATGEFDLLWVDGDHRYDGVVGDLERWFPPLAPGGHVVMHDCRTDDPVQQAILDFIDRTPVEILRSPYIPATHWLTEYGSMAHFRKAR
jgi:predicted O-methyltransferase YrrM